MARKAGAIGEGVSAPTGADPAVAAELASLRTAVDRLTQGLAQLADATATHTELLGKILEATTASTDPEVALGHLLEQLIGRIGEQSGLLGAVLEQMAKLPGEVGRAVGVELVAALTDLR